MSYENRALIVLLKTFLVLPKTHTTFDGWHSLFKARAIALRDRGELRWIKRETREKPTNKPI